MPSSFLLGATRFLYSLNIRRKFMLLLAFPVMGMLFFSLSAVIDKARVSIQMAELENLTKLAILAVEMGHEAQKEHSLSAAFLGSRDRWFGDSLNKQKLKTDEKIAVFRKT
ncbi:MAG: hypothetical protein GY862_15390, partial [Gammaproteobacteria bacterium]|nr:hypothetical protein [Gammaproteobacteria bacterium]